MGFYLNKVVKFWVNIILLGIEQISNTWH